MFKSIQLQNLSSMWSTLRSRLTYANVMSTVAVFLALGGGSFAAVSGGRDGGDKGGHHQKGDGSGGTGGGDQGGKDKGDKGNQNNSGGNNGGNDSQSTDGKTNGALHVTTRDGDPVSTDPKTDEAVASVSCENDERLVGGGVRTESERGRVRGQSVEGQPVVMSSGPDGDGWSARVVNSSGLGGVRVTAYAICAASQ